MEKPKFNLRLLLVLIAIISGPIVWMVFQLNWIHQRHRFLAEKQVGTMDMVDRSRYPWRAVPWSLRILGEPHCDALLVAEKDKSEAQSLFPEAVVGSP